MTVTQRAFAPPTVAQAALPNRWAMLALLVLANALNLFDRQLPFILVEQIRRDLSLNDTQIGLLGGVAFSLVYALMAIPLARVADGRSRKWVMIGCVTVWSAMTAAGGLARSFVQLAVSRAGVAVAEASCSPAAHSLISDLFPDRRSFALALFTAGVPAGITFGLAIGGILAEHLAWRQVLFLAGVPGLLLALGFLLVVREPARGHGGSGGARSFAAALEVLVQRSSFGWTTAGATLNALATAGGATFGAAFVMRTYHFTAGQAGLLLGVVGGVLGVGGSIMAGALGDRVARRDPSWRLRTMAISVLISTPLYIASRFAPSPQIFVALAILNAIAGAFYLPLTFAAIQSVVTSDMRATTSAVHQLLFNVFGAVLGPIFVGVLSDRWAPLAGERSLGWALAAVGGFGFLSAAAYWLGARAHARDVAAVLAEERRTSATA